MKYLIVSADDLGLSESIDLGILKGYEDGIVTSINVLPTGAAFYDAMASLRTAKVKEIGAHLALTETTPLADADKIPGLLAKDGKFHNNYTDFIPGFLLGKISGNQVYTELKSQMERLKETGFPITSLSSHQHIHMIPSILEVFIRLAKEYGVPAVRYLHKDNCYRTYTIKKIFKKIILGCFDRNMKNALAGAGLYNADNFIGFLDSGNITEELLIHMLNSLPEGTTELVTHPGFISAEVLDRCIFHRNCETDLAALTSRRVKKVIADSGIRLVTFGEFAMMKNRQ